jgi:hypothetical protein
MISLRKAFVLLTHALVVWIVCGATIGIGRTVLTPDATLGVHAVVAPAVSALAAFFYAKRFNYTPPLQTALPFVVFALVADAGLVAPVFEKSYAMFASVWGTWIPYRNTMHPPLSIWELRELRRKLHEAGRAHIDEAAIFEAYRRLREREARAVSETKRTRRARARRPQSVTREGAAPAAVTTDSIAPAISIENITPFEIEEL